MPQPIAQVIDTTLFMRAVLYRVLADLWAWAWFACKSPHPMTALRPSNAVTAPPSSAVPIGAASTRSEHSSCWPYSATPIRGKFGTIDRIHGAYVFPDTSVYSQGEKPQHVYSVRFSARELSGDQAAPQDAVYIDMWEDYLERA
jgi:hypothetical protein